VLFVHKTWTPDPTDLFIGTKQNSVPVQVLEMVIFFVITDGAAPADESVAEPAANSAVPSTTVLAIARTLPRIMSGPRPLASSTRPEYGRNRRPVQTPRLKPAQTVWCVWWA
jgi:hypothetical protein